MHSPLADLSHERVPSQRRSDRRRGVRRSCVALAAAFLLALVAISPVEAANPEDAVPINKNLYELTFGPLGGSSASGIGFLGANTAGTTGPTLSVEISGLTPNQDYRIRLAGPKDSDTNPTKCNSGVGGLAAPASAGVNFAYQGETLISASQEGVLRWAYDPSTGFGADALTELNNGEPAVVVTNGAGVIVACAELDGTANLIQNPTSRNFPVALKGGQSPVNLNGSNIKISGNVNLTGSLLTYDFTFRGQSLINSGAGLENHIIALRRTDDCGDGSLATALQNVEQMITNLGRPTTPATPATLPQVWTRSPLSASDTLRVQGSTVISTSDHTAVKDWGLILFGLESGGTAQPGGPNTLQTRQMTPSACVSLVDTVSEVGPGTIAEASTLTELINATDYDDATDPELLRLYNAFFGREPDVAGVRYWIQVSRGEAGPVEKRREYSALEVAGFFTGSQEFRDTFADAPSNSVFLERVYQNILGRQGEARGVAYWTDILNGTNNSGSNKELTQGTRGQVVFYVAVNNEFVNRKPYLP